MPYGQAPYPQPPVAPAKKGLGAGAIVAIVLGVLPLLGGIGGAVVHVVATSVWRFATAADVAACKTSFCDRRRKSHLKMLGAMKQRTALYVVRFAKPGSAQGELEDELGYFAVVLGQLVYLGQLIGLWE
jgi:hypothetical protein